MCIPVGIFKFSIGKCCFSGIKKKISGIDFAWAVHSDINLEETGIGQIWTFDGEHELFFEHVCILQHFPLW